MFGRKPSDGKDVLAARVRQLSETRPASPEIEAPVPSAAAAAPRTFSMASNVAKTVRSKERAPREPMFRTGTLVTSGGARQNVAIKNVSATGALIEFHTRNELPLYVVLIEPMLRLHKKAKVVWQIEGAAGLQFVD